MIRTTCKALRPTTISLACPVLFSAGDEEETKGERGYRRDVVPRFLECVAFRRCKRRSKATEVQYCTPAMGRKQRTRFRVIIDPT